MRKGGVRRTVAPSPQAPASPTPVLPMDSHRTGTTDGARPYGPPAPTPESLTARPGRVVAAGRISPLLVAAIAPHGLAAEQYRSLRTRLATADHGHPRRVLIVTSPAKGDGKSVTAANLTLTMAQEFNRRIVLVDADLRRPSVHRLFGLPSQPGLADVLKGDVALDEALVQLPEYQLTILPAGTRVDRQTELLGSQAMRRSMDALRSRFDRVVLDTPPALPLADVAVVAPMADGLVLVVRAGATPKPLIERALAACDESRLIGLVLNGTGDRDAAYESYAGQAAGE